jgi:nucleoside-diphosphate-sugar epimerase
MKILLTGATGFIGSHLARLLVNQGDEVYALVRAGSNLWRIKDIEAQLHVVQGDLLALEQMSAALENIRPEVCIHAAWDVEPGRYLTALENLSMLSASLHLASKLADMGCQRFVGIGTCFEYDLSVGYLAEESLTKPQTLYAASKLALQMVTEQLANITGMSVVWLRLFYQYGPYENRQRLVPAVICSLLQNQVVKVTKGTQIRDFLHVEDVVEAIWAVTQSNLSGPVNIGSGQPVTVQNIVAQIGTILNRPELILWGALAYNPSDPMFICANNRRLIENTAWTPRYDLEQGLRQTVDWWQRNLEIV